MGIASRSGGIPQRMERSQVPPVYKKSKGDLMASVWESRDNGVYNLTVRFQRIWVDGRGKTNFADSYFPEHLADLKELISEVEADCRAAIDEEKAKA